MSKSVACFRCGSALRPCDDEGREIIAGLHPGEPVMVEVKQSRSVRQHRLLFGMLRKVLDNAPLDQRARFPNVEALLNAVKIGTGYTTPLVNFDGETVLLPKSIAFDRMDQSEFSEFFKAAVEVVVEYVVEDLDEAELLAELEGMGI